MARPRRAKNREKKNEGGQPNLPGFRKSASAPTEMTRVLPMELQVGDRLTDETGEYEVIGRPYTTNTGKDAHVRVRRVDNAEITMIRSWGAHERVSVKREGLRKEDETL